MTVRHEPLAPRTGRPEVNIDVPAVVGQFLNDLSRVDLIIELVQNELDAGSRHTVIAFEEDALVCEGDGTPIDRPGWERLKYVLGAGGEVLAKVDGIGAKNHGLRSAFLIGDTITVQSAGHRIDLTARGHDTDSDRFFPAVWPRIRDAAAPSRGTRITVPYRAKTIVVTSGEGFPLAPPSAEDLQHLFVEAVREAASRFIAASTPTKPWRYELTLQKYAEPTVSLVFLCAPLTGRRKGLFRRTCHRVNPGQRAKLVEARLGAAFPIELAPDDRGKVPRVFRRGKRILGEINWRVDRYENPIGATGALGYPISYSTDHVRSGNGFNISGPFISGRARHSISDDERNGDIIAAARLAFAELTARQLVPLFGVPTLNLLCSERWPDAAAEDTLISDMLARGAFPVAAAQTPGKAMFGVGSSASGSASHRVSIASPTYDRARISSRLVRLAPESTNRLHPDAAPAAVAALLRALDAGDSRVTWFNELRAAEAVLISAPAASPGVQSAEWIDRSALALGALEAAKQQSPLLGDLVQRLRKEGRLPTEMGEPRPWGQVRRSGKPVPEVPGVTPPAILHRRLMKLALLREGGLRIEPFRIDEYVSERDFGPVIASGRQRFFNWLRKSHADLKPGTLSKIARYPIWPGVDGSYHPLDYYCAASTPWMRDLLAEVRVPPAVSVTSFPGLRKRGNGALVLRTRPTLEELQDWRRARAEALELLVVEGRQSEVAAELHRLEADMDRVRRTTEHAIDDITPNHRSLSRAGQMVGISELHVATGSVQRARLLDADVAAGAFDELYGQLGAATRPRAPALLRALKNDPDQERLFARLDAYRAAGRSLGELSAEEIILAGGRLRSANELTFPSSIDWWGQWKLPLDKTPEIPERVALLEQMGVVHQALREELSLAFFHWLAAAGAPTQRSHVQQVVRHWRERRHGPPRWIDRHSQLACIPVRGRGDTIELVSLQKATSIRSSIFLPDFPEVQDRVLEDHGSARLAITAAKGVADSVIDVMRDAGVRSLRREAGRPVSIRTQKAVVADAGLNATLVHIQSRGVLRGLTQRLPHFEVPISALRHDWRQHLSALKGVRVARELEAVFSILRREYAVPVDGGVDRATGLVCIDARVDPKLAFYEALAAHIFTESASGLWAYGLLRAIESRYEPTLFDFRAEFPDDDDPAEPGNPPPAGPSEPPKTGHGLAPDRLTPAVPNPMPLADISNPTTLSGKKIARPVRMRPKASTDDARNTIEEEEQKLQLKEGHYGWHCQACLGEYDVLKAAPPGSYVYLPAFRQRLIEAHHVTHLQNQGVIGGKNLIIICKFHHDYIGDRLSGEGVRAALRQAKPVMRKFPSNPDGTRSIKREGLLADIEIDAAPWQVRLYFTPQHAAAWLA